jgi:phosphoglycerate dehydrogenase-like enzyme
MDSVNLLVLGDPNEPSLARLAEVGPGVNYRIAKSAAELGPGLAELDAAFSWSGARTDLIALANQAPRLKWIHTRNVGLDATLSPELIESPVLLTNGRGTFSQSLGEFVIAGALYFAKDMPRMMKSRTAHKWDVFDVREISRQTIGIVGHGDIGRAIAWRAKAMGMRVLALRRDASPRAGDEHVDRVYATPELHSMIPECDYVAVAAPLTPQTRHLMGSAEFQLMKPSAVIMNVGRGPVIDESAMVKALQTKQIRGAFLDVFEVEPLPQDSPLWDLENVFVSAHTADHTFDWNNDAVQFFLEQLARWRRGEPLRNKVDKRAGY